jgi:protein-disulfide isomerase
MTNRWFVAGVLCMLVTLLPVSRSAVAQSDADLAGEVKRLREEVRALQRDVRELKQMLAARRAGGWERVDIVLGPEDSPQRGSPNAPLTLIEFSDYQCPYCARHFAETYPQIERDFIATGKLRYVVAEFPIPSLHPLALKAAEAARCAREQDRFWDMHARLFANQRQLEPWAAHAQALGLDTERFLACLDSGKYAADIQHNAAEAQRGGVSSTPTFLLGLASGDTVRATRRLRGAAPYAAFKAEIESLLADSDAGGAVR